MPMMKTFNMIKTSVLIKRKKPLIKVIIMKRLILMWLLVKKIFHPNMIMKTMSKTTSNIRNLSLINMKRMKLQ